MRKRRRILAVAALLVLIAVIDFILLGHLGVSESEPVLIRSWRLFLTVLLALFLALGKNSARWIVIVLTGLGALGGFVGAATLAVAGLTGVKHGMFLLIWLLCLTIVYGGISAFLAFSSGVAREIRRIREQI